MKHAIMKSSALFLCLLFAGLLHAAPRTSASYAITTDSTDAGGSHATSATYSHDGSAGGIGGISTVEAPSQTVKSGYIGQLYDIAAVQVSATPATVVEGGTLQLAASALLDDGTTLASLASAVSWSVVSGPITGISSDGLATAGHVCQATAATVQGSFFGASGTQGLTILNTGHDDLGIYAADGIDDLWQVQHFGENNQQGTAGFVSDASGLTNLFKFTAGLLPNDPASRFVISPSPVPTQPGQMKIVICPCLPDRIYTVKTTPVLGNGAVWSELTNFSTSDNGNERTIIDLDATGASKFYHVEISKP